MKPDIEEYIHGLLPARDPVLAEMEALAAEHNIAIVGPAVAGLLAQFVMISGARRMFELTSAIGHSTIWLARAAGEFDFAFNDADKQGYPDILEAVPVRLFAGGLFVTDNALRCGQLLNPLDEKSRQVLEFNRKLFKSKDFWTTLIPLRNSVLVSVRRKAPAPDPTAARNTSTVVEN